MTIFQRLWRALDNVFEALCLLCLAAVLFVVLWQVFAREFLENTPSWSEETARVLLIWIGFLMAALAFREGAHIAISFVVDRLPAALQLVVKWLVPALIVGFGIYLLVQGTQFTLDARVATLPGTGLPRSVMYVVMPVAGFMICLYTVLQVLGVSTQRYIESPTDDIHVD